eukprot:TRINITY_DN45728_c0_g1_i1.p1 TRINITY_DN45728_c0_g1~~TRINITY_DN45728_c0_g1_i1.p1  ORF type:complete len:264 (-),score=70.28 TRINITY_DN45728_c0_g1_i1:174-965(-)
MLRATLRRLALVEHTVKNKVATVTLNRPQALNALNSELVAEIGSTFEALDHDDNVSVIVLTGNGKAFAAGADIKEMSDKTFSDVFQGRLFGALEKVKAVRKPVIAAVNGFALGGGCELAMMCDIIIASEKARFGQPEITIGTIPGIGGTVRLTKAVGKAKSMLWNLSGEHFSAADAERAGLVSQVVPHDDLMTRANDLAERIAGFSRPVAALCKESVLNADEVGVTSALAFEKRAFQSTFALQDQKEGMSAFAEKRKPSFKDL